MARKDANPQLAAAIAKRRADVFDQRLLGTSIRAIAENLGVSATTVHNDLKHTLGQLAKQSEGLAEEYRAMELARLDTAQKAIVALVLKGHLGAVDRLLRIVDVRAKLLGLYQERIDMTSGGQPLKGYIGISPDDWKGGKDA